MTLRRSVNPATTAADAIDVINSLLPGSGLMTDTPTALRTSNSLSTQMQPVAMTPFAAVQALPGNIVYVDPTETYQQMFGAGAALTDSTCYVLANYCTPAQRRAILTMAFKTDGLSTARISMGSSDYTWRTNTGFYTYADNDDGSDLTLPNFSIAKDMEYIIPVLREALAINPQLKIFAAPWSPPAFMKNTGSLFGTYNGTLSKFNSSANNYTAYANYFVKFLQAYRALGIPIWSVAPQNEPNNGPANYTGCVWTGVQITDFIKVLGPALGNAGFGNVRIHTGDMDWTRSTGYTGASGDLVLNVWADNTAAGYCSGALYHGYTHGAHQFEDQRAKNWIGKEIHFTEHCAFPFNKSNLISLREHLGNCIIGAIRAGAQSVTFWNLFLDPDGQPLAATVAAGGQPLPCAFISKDGNATVTKTASYLALAHLTSVMKPNARRCRSTTFGVGEPDLDIQTVAFANPDGSTGVLVYNNALSAKSVSIVDGPSGLVSFLTLAAGDVASVNYTAPKGIVATGTLTVPNAVTGLTAALANGVPTLNWTAPAAPDASGLGGYVIRRSTSSGTEVITNGAALASATSFTDLDVVAGTTYYYQVFPFSAGGLAASSPEASILVTAPPATAPSAPTISAASGNGQNVISMPTAPANGGSAITSYNLFRSTTAGGEGATPFATGVTFPYTDAGLTNGTAYYYQATAINNVGPSAKSTEVSATPSATVTAPAHYLNLTGANQNAYNSGSQTILANSNSDGLLDAQVWSNLNSYVADANKNIPLVHRWNSGTATAANSQFLFGTNPSGAPILLFWPSSGSLQSAVSSATLASVYTPAASGVHIRCILNASSGAITSALTISGAAYVAQPGTAAFFYSLDGTTWTQLGTTVTGLPTVGLTTKSFPIVGHTGGSDTAPVGKIYRAIVRNSTQVVYNPDFTVLATGTATFNDTAPTPNAWTVNTGNGASVA